MTIRIKGLRWYILSLILFGTVLNYLARSSLSIAAPTLTEKLHMSAHDYSYVVAAFQAAYTIAQPIAGHIVDLLGLKLGFAIFAIAWAVANMLHGLAASWPMLAAMRGLLGIAESAIMPAAMKTVSVWFPRSERSIAAGIVNAGSGLGAMLAPPIVVYCILHYNWQVGFAVTGGFALIWAAAWIVFYRDPDRHTFLAPNELTYIKQGQSVPLSTDVSSSMMMVFRKRNFWGLAIARFLTEPAWQTFSFWIPLYLVSVRHMNLHDIAAFAWLPFLAADLGCVLGGYIGSFILLHFKVSVFGSRKLMVCIGASMMIGPACIGLVSSPYVAIALFCMGGFAHQVLSTGLYTLTVDAFPRQDVGAATGGAGMFGYLGGTLFSLLVGALAATIGYEPLFICLAVFDVTAAALLWLIIRPVRPEDHGHPIMKTATTSS